jgi:putative transposase
MARQLRIEYPGAICHVMARGERIAHEESDRYSLIETLGEACVKTGRCTRGISTDNSQQAV